MKAGFRGSAGLATCAMWFAVRSLVIRSVRLLWRCFAIASGSISAYSAVLGQVDALVFTAE